MYEALKKLSKHHDKLKNKILRYQYSRDGKKILRIIVVDTKDFKISTVEYEDGEWKFPEC